MLSEVHLISYTVTHLISSVYDQYTMAVESSDRYKKAMFCKQSISPPVHIPSNYPSIPC